MSNIRSLIYALVITGFIFFIELAGGFISNSLALLSDAGHMLTDVLALVLALFAASLATLPSTKFKTFGFYRIEILSALFNGSFLTLLALYIFFQAYQRLFNPQPIQSALMLVVATIGFVANLGAAGILARSSREDLNVRGAFLHVLSDMLSSLGVILGGVMIHFKGWYFVDPILGFLIGVLILRGALSLVYDAANVLLESVPAGISLDEIAGAIKKVEGVEDLHDLHLWSISSGINAISAHIVIRDQYTARAGSVLQEINRLLKEKYNISHSTFQTECVSCPEGLICQIEPRREFHEH